MKKRLLFLVLIFLLQSSYAQNNLIYQDTIPFRADLGLIIIPIKFNGVEKQFDFDTGANYSITYGWAKEELSPTKKTIKITSSSGLKSKMRFYKSGLIEFGSRKIRKHRILNTKENKVFSCHNIDGILGVDIIKEFNWTIDFNQNILIMYPADYFPEKVKNMFSLDFDFQKKRPYVFVKRKDKKIRFLLDTGAGGFSNISKREYNFSTIDDFPNLETQTANIDVNGILTSSEAKTVDFPEGSSKQVSINPIINYNSQKSSKIGNKLWRENELFLSLKKDKLYSLKSKILDEFEAYSCAVLFYKNKMRIVKIQKESLLWKNGVRQGDEILSYNGKTFTNFCDFDIYRRETTKTGKPFEIELKNGEKYTISKMTTLNNR